MDKEKLCVLQKAFDQLEISKPEKQSLFLCMPKERAETLFKNKYNHIKEGAFVLVEILKGKVVKVSEYLN